MAVIRRKRVSKKTKKSWRKNVDITDVEEFFEEQRLEERTGHKVKELADNELFEIHTVGDYTPHAAPDSSEKVKKTTETSTATREDNGKSRFRVTEKETPRCLEALVNKSAVKDPLIKRNRVKTREERRHPAVKKIFQERLEKGILTAKEKMSIKDRNKAEKERRKKTTIPQFKYELWSKENKDNLEGFKDWLREETVTHTLTNTGQKKKKVPKSVRTKTSLLPAIEIPHPGTSYNPSAEDHKEILQLVAETEKEMVDEEKHLTRVTTKMFSKVDRDVAEREWMTEMSVGLEQTRDEEDEEEEAGGYAAVNPPVKNKKKTLQKRRRLREDAKLKAQHRLRKIEKKKISDIYKLRKLTTMLKKRETYLRWVRQRRQRMRAMTLPFKTKTLCRKKYEEPLLEFAEEVSGNLRGVEAKSNILLDRYKSLQKRNVLEPATKQIVRKGKRKRYERESTKMGWEAKGY